MFRSLTVCTLAGVLLVACTATEDGQAGPSSGAADQPSSTGSSTKASRPNEVKLDGVDPCALFTPQQMDQLAVAEPTPGASDVVDTGDVPNCTYLSTDSSNTYGISPVLTRGVEYWLDASGNFEATATEIRGYRAAEVTLLGAEDECSYAVDVADGQHLFVEYLVIGSKDDPGQDGVCDRAKTATEMALETLKTLR